MELRTESTGGSFELTTAAGIDLQVGFAFFKVAAQFELSALFVGHQHVTVSKSKESQSLSP